MSGKHGLGISVFSFLALLLVLLALLGGWIPKADPAVVEGRLLDERYAEAAEGLARLVEESAGSERERLLYLLGEARFLAGDVEAALDAFAALRREAPLSAWHDKAAFRQAEALGRSGRHRQAAELLSARVGALFSEERKAQVAGVYLRLAARALEGERSDYLKARGFLDLALELGLTGALAETVAFQAAEQALLAREWRDGIQRLETFLREWPDSGRRLQGRYRLAEALREAGRLADSRLIYRELARSAAGTEWAPKALWGLAKSFGMPEPSSKEHLVQGVAALRRLTREYPASELAVPASLGIARAWLGDGAARFDWTRSRLNAWGARMEPGERLLGEEAEEEEVLEEVEEVIDPFEKDPWAPGSLSPQDRVRTDEAWAELESLLERFGERPEAAEARYLKGVVLRMRGDYAEALAAYRDYLARHPGGNRWRDAQAALVDCAYEQAQAMAARGQESFDQAIELYRAFLSAHPLDGRAGQVLLAIAKLELERERWQAALAVLREACARHPKSEVAAEARYLLGAIRESRLDDPAGALEEWKRLDWMPRGNWRAQAAAASARLRQPSLRLRTERVYRTAEKGRFTLESRGIPSVRVRVFALDLEAYFRATHTSVGIESLRIDVIEPDATFESAVEGYRPMVETRREVELPFSGPGAYVVKVDDGRLEASTLVLVSDLDLIVKGSRAGLFVFAQNSAAERPQSGARVVVSDGGSILVEGQTGADGVFVFKHPALLTARGLGVFATAPDGSGASTLDLAGLGAPRGLEAKGFVFTDRPAYRPGQDVRVKALLRDVDAGVYVLPKSRDYTIAYRFQGRQVWSEQVALTPFGTLSGRMTLPREGGFGEWTIAVRPTGSDGKSFQGRFQVADYSLPQVHCLIEPESLVVLRGEELRGKARATWFTGEPLVGEPLSVRFEYAGVDFEVAGVTDAAGVVPFRFATAELAGAREELARLEAWIPGRGVGAEQRVLVAGVAMSLRVRTARELYLTGEHLEAEVFASDRLGTPLATKLTVSLLRRVETRGVLGERPVARKKISTAGEDGSARLRFELEHGGRHLLRVSGLDRFGNPVFAEKEFDVSGSEDERGLLLLADRERWAAGERLAVRVVNRSGRGLALFTSEAEGVFAWQALVLPAGESPFTLELDRSHAPNFRLAVARVAGTDLHQARLDLLVSQALSIAVKPERREAEPGSTLGLDLVAVGPDGAPQRAELTVAVVDEALLTLFPESRERIDRFFFGARRALEVRSASSCGFHYEGRTREVPEELLREAHRRRERDALEAPLEPGLAGLLLPFESEGPEDPGSLARRLAVAGQRLDDPLSGRDSPFDKDSFSDILGIGGGAGGGSRFGGRFARRGDRFQDLSGTGDSLVLREEFPETALWLPEVITDAEGRARVVLTLPGSLTSWKVRVVGVSEGSLIGEGEASFLARKSLLAELELPQNVVEGDVLEVRVVARNHGQNPLPVILEASDDQGTLLGKGEFELAAGGQAELPIRLEGAGLGQRVLMAQVRSGELSDAVRRTFEVLPRGSEHVAWASGVEQGDRVVTLELPEGREWRARSLELRVGGRVPDELVQSALQGPGTRRWRPAPSQLDRICRGLGALSALEALRRSAGVEGVGAEQLRELIEEVALSLASTSHQGAWAHSQLPAQARRDPVLSAYAVRYLARMRALGFEPPPGLLESGVGFLKEAYPSLTGLGERALALRALAEAGQAPLEWLQTLRRTVHMGPAARATLMLAYVAAGRPEAAGELVAALKAQALSGPDGALFWEDQGDRSATTGMAVSAILALSPGDTEARMGGRWLLSHRGWTSPAGHAAALEALAALEGPGEAGEGTLSFHHGGRVVLQAELGQAEPAQVRLSGERIDKGPVELRFSFAGRGRYAWSARLSGWTREPDPSLQNRYLELTRAVTVPPERFRGRAIPAGFSKVTGPGERFENLASGVPVASGVEVKLRVAPLSGDKRPGGFFVIEEPLPAGTVLVPGSVWAATDLLHWEIRGGRLLIYFGSQEESILLGPPLEFRYALTGVFPGSFQHLPARVYPLERPGAVSESAPGRLEVLPRGAARPDAYRRTPDELYHLGLAAHQAGEHEAARVLLEGLLREWRLVPEAFKAAARANFELALLPGEPGRLAAAFELLREAWPGLELPFEQGLAAAEALLSLGEFERAGVLFLALAEASFLREARVGRALEAEGEHLEAAERVLRLFYAYPALPAVRSAFLDVGLELGRKAAALAPGERLGDADRNALQTRSLHILREFLLLHPGDSLAPEATFALANGWLGLRRWEQALEWAGAGVRRYPGSRWLDRLQLLEGYALFALDRHSQALEALRAVAEGSYPDGRGGQAPSPQRWLALFLAGQIHQARGERQAAEAALARVADRFDEAARSLAFLRQRRLELPELTVLEPGRPGEVELRWRNLPTAHLRLYRVDLASLFALERGLGEIAEIRLAGIRPQAEERVPLVGWGLLDEGSRRVTLPLERTGAYLVVAQSADLVATGLVLRTALDLRVQVDPGAGRVGVHLFRAGVPVAGAYVNVFGHGDGRFHSGETDLSGAYSIEGLAGAASVLVQAGEEYALYRSEVAPTRAAPRAGRPSAARPGAARPGVRRPSVLEELERSGEVLRGAARERLDGLFGTERRGVLLEVDFNRRLTPPGR